jgi:hypothetical protein
MPMTEHQQAFGPRNSVRIGFALSLVDLYRLRTEQDMLLYSTKRNADQQQSSLTLSKSDRLGTFSLLSILMKPNRRLEKRKTTLGLQGILCVSERAHVPVVFQDDFLFFVGQLRIVIVYVIRVGHRSSIGSGLMSGWSSKSYLIAD